MKVIEFKNVHKEFSDGDIKVNALKNINLELYKGEFVALIGPSGCGKSTLLNLITNLYKPTKGNIYLNGANISNIDKQRWPYILQNEIGFIYQYYELIDCLDTNDNIKLKQNCNENIIDDLLKKLDIYNYKYQKVKYLSGGQRQRVGVVRALTNSPSLILADEPTGALDQENSEILLNTLKEYSNDALVVMVTHNEELALKYVSKVIYMDHGEITSIREINNQLSEIKKKREKEYKILSPRLGMKYLVSTLLTLKVRLVFLICSGSIIFLFISILFCALTSASIYIDETYINTPLYSVFDVCTYSEENGKLIANSINNEVLAKLMKEYKNVTFRENIDSILNENVFSQISYENKIINNIKVYSLPSSNNHKYILNGRNIQNNNEILINESFKSFFEGSEVIGRYLNIQEKYIYKGKEYIKDSYKEIVGITKDSLFNQNNEIYVSYEEYFSYLQANHINNTTYFDIFCNFDYQMIINNISNVEEIIETIKDNPYYRNKNNIVNHPYQFSIKENIAYEEKIMFDELLHVVSLLVYFFIILGLTIFTIFTSYVLSSFVLENKKDYAIFLQLGIRKLDTYYLIIKQSLFISLTMILIGLFLLYIAYFIVSKLIIFKVVIPFIPLLILIFLYLIQCLISSLLPIYQLRKMEIGNILQSE